jgi:hypothetical protein
VSAVDYNNQTDSMRCKEHITTSNFIISNNVGMKQKASDKDLIAENRSGLISTTFNMSGAHSGMFGQGEYNNK